MYINLNKCQRTIILSGAIRISEYTSLDCVLIWVKHLHYIASKSAFSALGHTWSLWQPQHCTKEVATVHSSSACFDAALVNVGQCSGECFWENNSFSLKPTFQSEIEKNMYNIPRFYAMTYIFRAGFSTFSSWFDLARLEFQLAVGWIEPSLSQTLMWGQFLKEVFNIFSSVTDDY